MQKAIKKLGLSDNEVKVYLTLLSLKSASISVLSYRCGIPRNSCRYICNGLVSKKLLFTEKKGNTFIYKVEPPEKLYYLIEQEEKRTKDKRETLDRIIADLKIIEDPESLLPKVKYYQGYEGVKESYHEMLNRCQGKDIIAIFAVVEELGKELQDFFVEEYVPKRVKKGIKMKNMCLKSPKTIAYKKRDQAELRETKYIPKNYLTQFNTEMNIFDDHMHYMSFDEKNAFAMIVKNEYITSVLRSFFNIIWDMY